MSPKELLELILSRYITIIGGRYGTGKSLTLTALTYFSIFYEQRTNVLTNMPLNFPVFKGCVNYVPFLCTSQIDNIKNNTILVWDEMYADLFSRNSSAIKNKYTTIFSRDIRKIDGRIFGSVQFFDMLEKNMALILETIIIPEFVNEYSKDRKKDMIERFKNKDFLLNWHIIDKLEDKEYNLKINLYKFLNLYNTYYKPMTLFLNHSEYVEKLQKKKREFDLFNETIDNEILYRKKHFEEGLKIIL